MSSYPKPMVIQPIAAHTHTIILLHGRGLTGHEFGSEFSKATTSAGHTLSQIFPGLKFIFPTAKSRKSTVLGTDSITQWLDVYSLTDPSQREELQVEGLNETSKLVHWMLEKEVKAVGRQNVLLGGMSQGCTAGLGALLSYQPGDGGKGGAVRGFVGLSGCMPLRKTLIITSKAADMPAGQHGGHSDGGFRGSGSNVISINSTAASFGQKLKDIGSGKSEMPDSGQVPLFLGHGEADDGVSVELARQAARALRDVGFDLTLKTYTGLGPSWSNGDDIDDIVEFLTAKCGLVAQHPSDSKACEPRPGL